MEAVNSNEIQISNTEIFNILSQHLPEQQAEIVTKIYDVLDAANFGEYIEELQQIKDVDQTDIDPIDLVDSIKGIARKYARLYIKQRGIILSEEHKAEIPNSFYYNMLLALIALSDLDVSEAVTILAILEDPYLNNDKDKLQLILDVLNPNIERYNFHYYVEDIADELFNRLKNYVEKVIENSDISIDDLDNEKDVEIFTKLTKFFLDLGFNSLPNMVMIIIHDPDMLEGIINNVPMFKSNIIKKMNVYYKEFLQEEELNENILSIFMYEVVDYYILTIIESLVDKDNNKTIDEMLDEARDELLELYALYVDSKNKDKVKEVEKIIRDLRNDLLKEVNGQKLIDLLKELVETRKDIEESKDV